MTFYKYLVAFGLLAAACGTGRAADASGDAEATGSSSSTATPTVHHRRHHSAISSSTNTSAKKNAADTATNHGAKSEATATTATNKSGGKKNSVPAGTHSHSPDGVSKSNSAKGSKTKERSGIATAEDATTAKGKTAASTAETSPAGTHHHPASDSEKNKAVAGDKTSAHPATASTTGPTTTSSRRHHRLKSTMPQPLIVTPSTTPLQAPPVSSPIITLPAPGMAPAPSPAIGAGPMVETGLPVPRPGAGTTATLPVTLGRAATGAMKNFTFTDFPMPTMSRRPTHTYPWRTDIKTTVFWIGEGGSALSSTNNLASAWDIDWTHHNGGADDPDEMSTRSGYSSLTHASTLNPFYIALPFNDLAYPEQAERWLPAGWYKPVHHGEKPVSACQHRWVEIKNHAGRVCYAQWEDVGPLVSNHPEYVFGDDRPNTVTGAGLDVSPAVAKYLGIGLDSSGITSWRFVDDDDVQPGMWLRYDEQALLFRAIKEQMNPHNNPRIQDLSEPLPDGSAQDSDGKRSGAARG